MTNLKLVFSALVLAVLLPAGNAGAQSLLSIHVSLTDYAFTPDALSLKTGVTYQLHFTNDGSKSHNFSAPEFFAASQIAPADQAKLKQGVVELDKGAALDIAVTPTSAGTYKFLCTHFMHSMMGMHGNITVQ